MKLCYKISGNNFLLQTAAECLGTPLQMEGLSSVVSRKGIGNASGVLNYSVVAKALVQGLNVAKARAIHKSFIVSKWTHVCSWVPLEKSSFARLDGVEAGFASAVLTRCTQSIAEGQFENYTNIEETKNTTACPKDTSEKGKDSNFTFF